MKNFCYISTDIFSYSSEIPHSESVQTEKTSLSNKKFISDKMIQKFLTKLLQYKLEHQYSTVISTMSSGSSPGPFIYWVCDLGNIT